MSVGSVDHRRAQPKLLELCTHSQLLQLGCEIILLLQLCQHLLLLSLEPLFGFNVQWLPFLRFLCTIASCAIASRTIAASSSRMSFSSCTTTACSSPLLFCSLLLSALTGFSRSAALVTISATSTVSPALRWCAFACERGHTP